MGIFSDIFGKGCDPSEVRFGRCMALSPGEEQAHLLAESDTLYNDGNCSDGYLVYMKYLKSLYGDAVEIETVDDMPGNYKFVIRHGSKEVICAVNSDEVAAECVVATCVKPDVALMRYVLSRNADMLYSKYGLSDENIVLCQRCPVKNMSVSSFSDMLSEIALSANLAGEHMEAEFPELAICRHSNIITLSSQEVDTKVTFLRAWINDTFRLVETTEVENLKSYIILSATFKILFLISPEGALLSIVSDILDIYSEFAPEANNNIEINYRMLSVMEDIMAMPDHELAKSMYRTHAVFQELNYKTFLELADSISSQLKLAVQCSDIRRPDLVPVMCEYIVGAQSVRFGLHQLAYDLLMVFWRVLNTEYFYGLGFREMLYNDSLGVFAKDKIADEINAIVGRYYAEYPGLKFDVDRLSYESQASFACSFLIEFKNLQIPD